MLLKYETFSEDVALRTEFENSGMKEAADMEMCARKLCANVETQVTQKCSGINGTYEILGYVKTFHTHFAPYNPSMHNCCCFYTSFNIKPSILLIGQLCISYKNHHRLLLYTADICNGDTVCF
jgi:hypothetical protein